MSHSYKSAVQELIDEQYLVSFEFEPQNDLMLWGFVIECSETLTIVNRFDRDLYDLDGFSVFYNEDVSEYWVYTPEENYLETKYIEKAGITPQASPNIEMDDIGSVVRSLGDRDTLVSIYRDHLVSDSNFAVGRIAGAGEKSFGVLGVRTDGVWKKVPTFFRLEDVSRIDFGTRYLNVLSSIAGNPDSTEYIN